ncbi:hypothetical protein CAOG_05812 [Capsaspora owczarzaki ATCC 30864]|uniref:hypothetical protein n=1 Tax=Capsaspora owczarzaki (strain ATCC 30864) TaxID=595528 RepID=UPI0001FE2F7F|nr:hypothetical protein CAOG_05812 [Capsaspora owczarzaki ATCC 30864]|eukprot:XP_004345402.1 hypothetical protein CAOG_05812 [Capsaspora owczarzaki ATCC 30864]
MISLREKQIGEAGAHAIAEALKVNKTLTVLDLGNRQIGVAAVKALAEALNVSTTLTTLDLGHTEIDHVDIQAIAGALKVNTTLTWLNLGENRIGDVGAEAIAEALKVNKTVTKLDLQQNQIEDEGAQAIAEALKVNTTLTELNLSQDEIGGVGGQAIADALKVNKTLTKLDLFENPIGDAGAQAIGEALKVNTTLPSLHLYNNQIGDDGAKGIAEGLKVNKTLTFLYLKDNFLTNAGRRALRRSGNTTCRLEGLADQRDPPPAPLVQIAANAQSQPAVNLTSELQQLRSDLAAKDQALAAKDQELQQLRSDLKSALDQIDVLERGQPAVGSLSHFDGPIPRVSLATLANVTKNFAADAMLGEGAFGRVYGASLPGPRVAIKKLSAESKQGRAEFKSELASLSKFRHTNIIAILSYAEEGDERCLVYEYMANGSVRDRLNCKNNTLPLTWSQRQRIAADVSRGMHYVQTAFPDHALFHLDLKTDNVLLDAHFNAKVSDFGLVRAAEHLDDKSYLRTQTVQGTVAYMCPEFLVEGRMTTKTDVFAYGMILLELLTAAKPGPRLKNEARKAVKNQKLNEVLDSRLDPTESERQSVSELVSLALECLDEESDDRPSFGAIVVTLDL